MTMKCKHCNSEEILMGGDHETCMTREKCLGLISDLIHDFASTVSLIYFGIESLNPLTNSTQSINQISKEMWLIMSDAIIKLRKQLECYRTLASSDSNAIFSSLVEYLTVNGISCELKLKQINNFKNFNTLALVILWVSRKLSSKSSMVIEEKDNTIEISYQDFSRKTLIKIEDIRWINALHENIRIIKLCQ